MSIETGQAAPDFNLADQDHKPHRLLDYRGKWVVLYFYPKDDTPGCAKEACNFRDGIAELKNRKAVVLGVSPDDAESHAKFAAKFSLPFPLLADEGHELCEAYGVWKEKINYGKTYMGVERTTFLIDPKGKVAERWSKVKVDGHDEEVLAKLTELSKG